MSLLYCCQNKDGKQNTNRAEGIKKNSKMTWLLVHRPDPKNPGRVLGLARRDRGDVRRRGGGGASRERASADGCSGLGGSDLAAKQAAPALLSSGTRE